MLSNTTHSSNNLNPRDRLTIDKLQNAPFWVYQTGSRSFGYATPHSDWDFYTINNAEVLMWLQANGFAPLASPTNPYYEHDLNLAVVYRCGNVDVQLVKSVEKKFLAQEIIKSWKLGKLIKSYAHKAWNNAYKLLDSVPDYLKSVAEVLPDKPPVKEMAPVRIVTNKPSLPKYRLPLCEMCDRAKESVRFRERLNIGGNYGHNMCADCTRWILDNREVPVRAF